MKKSSTVFLRITLVVLAVIALLMCIFAFPEMWKGYEIEDQRLLVPMRGIIIAMYVSAVPFLVGLWQSWKLLNYIDKNIAFSDLSIKALKVIKFSAASIALFVACVIPFFYGVAEIDDAPGLVIVGLGLIGAPIAVAVFATVLQKLLRNAIQMKNENELTV